MRLDSYRMSNLSLRRKFGVIAFGFIISFVLLSSGIWFHLNQTFTYLSAFLFGAAILLFLSTLVLLQMVVNRIIGSIDTINQTVSGIRTGQPGTHINITSLDEFGRMAKSIDGMIERLSQDIHRGVEQLKHTKKALDDEIQNHRLAEQALSKSELLFRKVWEISVDGMRLTSEDGNIIAVNDAFCKLVGMQRDDLIGQPFPIIYHTDERQHAQQMYKTDLQNNAIKTHFEQERSLWNGQRVWFEFSNSIFNVPGSGIIVLSIINDITQRKHSEIRLLESEKRFKMLFNNANDAVLVNHLTTKNNFDHFIEVNDLACLRLGYGRNELLEMNLDALIPSGNTDELKRAKLELLQRRHALFELNLIRHDKRQMPVEISAQVFEYDNRPTVLFIARDITKRKKVEQRLHQTSEQLRNLASKLQTIREDERTMIAREIHDELGQVLTVLKIQISLLGNKLHRNQDSERERIESVLKEIDRIVESVQRITAKLRPGILDELGLVPAIEWQSQDFQNQTGIQCEYNLPGKEINLSAEKSTAIFRIFQEALTNIARHARADKVSVTMKQHNEHLILEITDNGRGILQSQIEHANSLGILGMKERALILGGKVHIYGSPGQGTNVKVEMPRSS